MADRLSNVILFTRGTKGDLYPFLSLGRGLKERGCKVTLLSNFCYEKYAFQEGFDFAALDDEELFEILNNVPEFHSKLSSLLKLYTDHILPNLEKELKIIQSKVVAKDTVILAHNNDYLAPLFAMEKLNIPLYLCVLAPYFIYSFSLIEAVYTSLSVELNQIRARIGLEPIRDWKKWLNSFKGCFALWPDWFSDDALNVIPDLEYLGFLSIDGLEAKPLRRDIREFVGVGSKNILITHGTSRPYNELYFKFGIDVCQKYGYKLIVSTPFRDLLPQTLPANVIWSEFCPFYQLFPLVDLIIHHGGIGTARESVAHALPQLIIGQGFDRQHNGRIIKRLGLGDWIVPKALSEDVLSHKIRNLLDDQEIKSTCKRYQSRLESPKSIGAFYEKITDARIADKSG